MRHLMLAAAFSCLLSGCTSTYTINRNSPAGAHGIAQVNNRAEERETIVLLANGAEIKARDLHVGYDSTSLTDLSTGKRYSVGSTEVRTVVVRTGTVGALEGLGFGFLGGALLGTIGATIFSHPTGDYVAGLAQAIGAIGGAFVGGTVGILAGSSKGHTYKYQFLSDSLHLPPR